MDLFVSISFFLWQTLYAGGDIGGSVILDGQETAQFNVEIMREPEERERGLMSRLYLPSDRGMLFLYEEEKILRFWMKNTLIPLDILYFDHEGVLVDMKLDIPPCLKEPCPLYPSLKPAQMVLEVAAGTVERIGLELGEILISK